MPLDTSETQKLLDAIDTFQTAARTEGEAILTKGAVEAKKNLQADARRSQHFRQIGKSIDFDKRRTPTGVEIELGPNKDRDPAAPLANIAYFGGANGGGGTLDLDGPVERELDVIDDHLQRLGELL